MNKLTDEEMIRKHGFPEHSVDLIDYELSVRCATLGCYTYYGLKLLVREDGDYASTDKYPFRICKIEDFRSGIEIEAIGFNSTKEVWCFMQEFIRQYEKKLKTINFLIGQTMREFKNQGINALPGVVGKIIEEKLNKGQNNER